MPIKKFLFVLYNKIPSLKKYVYSIFCIGMKIITPLILVKLNKGKFLNREIKKINNIEIAINFCFSFHYLTFSMKMIQIKCEIIKFLEIFKELKPKIILEIGTAGGGTLCLFTKIADPKAIIISVDLPKGTFGGGYPKWKIPIFQSFKKKKQKIKLFRVDSHNPKTLKLVKNFLDNKMVDFLFIDADHTYKGVKKDFEMYSGLVRKGGIIAFHDIIMNHSVLAEVGKYWDEIKHNYKFQEIVKDINQKSMGIGVLYL